MIDCYYASIFNNTARFYSRTTLRGVNRSLLYAKPETETRYELLTNDNTISDNNRGKRDSERSHADTNGDGQATDESDLSKCESLHHRAAYQTQTTRDCSIQMKNEGCLCGGDTE